jgi:transcriptional regulator with XRE-family HTH domain
MNTFGTRLRSERKRLGYTQEQFSEACAISKSSQLNYERDARIPDASYLRQAATLGVDVLFVITEQHAMASLSQDEARLLDHYRSQSSRNKLAVQYLLAGMGHGASEGEALSQTAQRELALLAALRQGQPQHQAGPDEGLDQ